MAEHDGVEDDRTLAIPELQDAQLGRLVRHLADAVVIADAMGTIVFWNTAAQAMFGWSAGEAVGRSLDLIIPERLRKRHWDGYVQVVESGHTEYGNRLLEVPSTHRDGRAISVAFTVTLLMVDVDDQRVRSVSLRLCATTRSAGRSDARHALKSPRSGRDWPPSAERKQTSRISVAG